MFGKLRRQNSILTPGDKQQQVDVLFDRAVYTYMLHEIQKYPDQEEGGKHVGYLLQNASPLRRELGIGNERPVLLITDFLPSGPNAKRSAVEFLPDGEYQERIFRCAEQLDPEVEHLGSWHSHHCNGLRQLSDGDVRGYFRTVNKNHYRPDFFLASLIKEIPEPTSSPSDWIGHFLFIRDVDEYYDVTSQVRLVDSPTRFSSCTGHAILEEGTKQRQSVSQDDADWHSSPEGRKALAVDKSFFEKHFAHVIATRKSRQITLTGELGHTTVSLRYPASSNDQDAIVFLRNQNSETILEIHCDLDRRTVALKAAMSAASLV